MAFFDPNNGIWRSLLNKKGQHPAQNAKQLLSEASAANRTLGQEDAVRPSVHGVLSVKIRMASLIKFEKNSIDLGGSYCAISIRNLVKRTQVAQNVAGILKWDQMKHFPIQVVRNRRHPYNMVKIELFGCSPNSMSEIVPIGSVSFHLHDILSSNPIAGTYDLWNENIQIGDIDLEFTHTYGSFGYGYSPQLKEEDLKPDEIINYSLFPRVIPSRDKREQDHQVMVVCATPHPSFIKFKERVYLSYGKEIRETLDEAAQFQYRPVLFEREMGDYEQVRDEYFSTSNRFARLTFLKNYLKGSTNQDTVTVSLQDETNLEGDTQHRILVSKEYIKFVNSSSDKDPANTPETLATSPQGQTNAPTSPKMRSTLQAASDLKKTRLTGSWGSNMFKSATNASSINLTSRQPSFIAGIPEPARIRQPSFIAGIASGYITENSQQRQPSFVLGMHEQRSLQEQSQKNNQLTIPGAWPGK